MYATLELRLLLTAPGVYRLDMRYSPANSAAEVQLIADADVRIDPEELLAASLDPAQYGLKLGAMLFADAGIATAWEKARAAALGASAPLRIRLAFDAHDPLLTSLRWETLHHPAASSLSPLVADENMLWSRYPFSADMTPIALRPRKKLSVLVAIANPSDSQKFRLPPLDVERALGQTLSTLESFNPTVLAQHRGDSKPTFAALLDALRSGPDVLYLVCHGTVIDHETYLWLEQEDGTAQQVAGNVFAQRIAALSRRPIVIVLALCHGSDGSPSLAVRLAEAGVPSIVAMQSKISLETTARFSAAFFQELSHDGQIDRALAASRAAVLDRDDWWAPALFLRLRTGSVWLPIGPYEVPVGLSSPFPALEAFTIADERRFFGRAALVREGVEAWNRSKYRFLAVVGSSGSGKSSLAQAGLIPELLRQFGGLGYSAETLLLRPGAYPLSALHERLRRLGVISERSPDFDEKPTSSAIADLVAEWCLQHRRALIIFIDQFEELFTLCNDTQEREAFDTTLHHLTGQQAGVMSVLITLRSDFYPRIDQLTLREHIATYQLHVRNLYPEEMEEAITEPVRRVAVTGSPSFEPGLVATMVRETGVSPGALPLLAFTLNRLWDCGHLDFAAYHRLGGVRGALNHQAEQTYRELNEQDRQAVRYLLLRLVQLGEGSEDTRRRALLADLVPAEEALERTQAIVQRLAAARLVTTMTEARSSIEPQEQSYVEVSHEALIRDWQRLRTWIEEERE